MARRRKKCSLSRTKRGCFRKCKGRARRKVKCPPKRRRRR